MIDHGNESEIAMDEIVKALKSMKVEKARVSSEMLRGGGGIVASLLYQFCKCWKSHRVPNDWCKTVILHLYKGKDTRQVYTNYRSISLLNVVGKLYAKIVIKRIMNETENKTWDVEAGFRKEWDVRTKFFSLRNIAENFWPAAKRFCCCKSRKSL
ncbi:hypothetical protein EVAR_76776_1 [Eumeta japonica]|uniref:Uncharacterized protein n=1 Tax=Eumeta variegata TaxID=151549 RepID=A0A4C1SVW9_EUMVA|nr:hypothetical protein EVAR_76776_1 [Eumeta japonica]